MATLLSSPQTAWLNQELAEVRAADNFDKKTLRYHNLRVIPPFLSHFLIFLLLQLLSSFLFPLFKWPILAFVSAKTVLRQNSK